MSGLITALFLLALSGAAAAPAASQPADSTLAIEALVRHYDAHPAGRHLPGYQWDRLFRRREFHQPVTLTPLEIHYGLGFYGGGGRYLNRMPQGWMTLAGAVAPLESEQSERICQHLDLDLFKINLSHYLLGGSWADINTGLNLFYSAIFGPADVPVDDWGAIQPSWNPGDRLFNPRVVGAGLSNALTLQWDEWWFLTLRYTYGLATAKFYMSSDGVYDDKPSGWGPAVSYDLGVRFILDRGQTIRYSFGIELRHSYVRLNRIDDPADVTPIESLRLPANGIFLTLSAFYGERLTTGDLGKQFYFRRDYITARDKLNAFLTEYPRHANRRRAQRLIEDCQRNIPEQLYREGRRFEQDGNFAKALERYHQAQAGADTNLTKAITAAFERIGTVVLERAETLEQTTGTDQALALVQEAAGYSRRAATQVPQYAARAAMQHGKIAFKYGFYTRALEEYNRAYTLDPRFGPELEQLRFQVAAALIRQANAVEDLEAIRLAVQSLEEAAELLGGLNESGTAVLAQLRERLARYDEGQVQRLIDRRMAEARENLHRQQTRLMVGMTVPEVQELLGEPAHITYKTDPDGTDYQLWIYRLNKTDNLELSFRNYILFKIEQP